MLPQPTKLSKEEETYLLTLPSIRERCELVYQKALLHETQVVKLDLTRLPECIDYVSSILKKNYPNSIQTILPHSRLRHYSEPFAPETNSEFNSKDGKESNKQKSEKEYVPIKEWEANKVESMEIAKRVFDLMTVSVLLDAGAGDQWKYKPNQNTNHGVYKSSEGLAMAVLDMFLQGVFSSKKDSNPCQVDAKGLKSITLEEFKKGFQVTEENPLVGLENRCTLLHRLGSLLETIPHFQSSKEVPPRPGNMIDALLSKCQTQTQNDVTRTVLSIHDLWSIVISLQPVFSPRVTPTTTTTTTTATSMVSPPLACSDVFYCPCIAAWIPFHKLSQWLTYTYVDVLARFLKIHVQGSETELTGLAEYRNGGLFMDFGILQFKPFTSPPYTVDSPAIVEWRACTIVLLDLVAQELRKKFQVDATELGLGKVLEGTWKAGRAIAKELRPSTGSPPIEIIRDGTIF